ncbi:hypothetical protein [Bartonella sp. OT172YNZD]
MPLMNCVKCQELIVTLGTGKYDDAAGSLLCERKDEDAPWR